MVITKFTLIPGKTDTFEKPYRVKQIYTNMDVLKDILDNLNDSIIVIDPFGQIILFNNEALRIQKSISEKPIQIGDHFLEVVTPERKETVAEILKTIKGQKKAIKSFAEFNTPSGGKIFLEICFIPVFSKTKKLKYVNILTHDITFRKNFERKARHIEADVKNVMDNANAIILSVDSRGYIVDWNNHCARVTGFSKNDIYSKKFVEILVKEYHAPVFQNLMEMVLKNSSLDNYEIPIQTKTGNEILVMVSATPRTNLNGQVIGATLVGQDITELTEYRRSMENLVQERTSELQRVLKKEKQVVEMKSRFVSIASHEFRTPLSSIDFTASFIRKNSATIGSKKLHEKIKVIEKHVGHMSHLLDDVLVYSQNEAGKIRLIPSNICLDVFSRSLVEEVACNTKHSHKICLSTNQVGCLITDEKLLRTIMINLLINAIKFSPEQQEIFLMIQDLESHIIITVRDQGLGIPKEEMEIIFEPFIRGKAVNNIQGTGLGLSIVKKAVELLCGTIKADSTPGKGSVFTVAIPRMEAISVPVCASKNG